MLGINVNGDINGANNDVNANTTVCLGYYCMCLLQHLIYCHLILCQIDGVSEAMRGIWYLKKALLSSSAASAQPFLKNIACLKILLLRLRYIGVLLIFLTIETEGV